MVVETRIAYSDTGTSPIVSRLPLASLVERVYTRDLKPLQFKVRILDEAFSYNSYYGIVAPTVERVPEEDGVVGSNPTDSTYPVVG